ncbi:BnaA09g57030D [Brassica napus]|uniref:BnaA09g57030D protein n=1 Tax=Brassica napus TaxID=3708 RepID=A0A078IVX9_BRANA|nr:BnaA09g57030D [Brassica napus]
MIILAAIFHSSNSHSLTCHPRDLEALRDFVNELSPKPDTWDFNSTGDCSEWEGITCDSVRVTKLKLVSKTLSGKLSESLGRLHHLRVLNLSRNFISGSIPPSIFNLTNLEALDLSSNGFTGLVPESLNLPSLKRMTSLEVLDLSNNNLSGSIPSSLQKLTFLSKFSVVNNSLSGRIPTGGQFQTFPNSSFEGNHVCGDHRFDCQADTPDLQRPSTSDESDNSGSDFALDFSYGVALGQIISLQFGR